MDSGGGRAEDSNHTMTQHMAEQVAVCVTEFLHRAPAWSADPGRSDEELRDSARRMIYWVMKERWARRGKKEKKDKSDGLVVCVTLQL